MAEQTMRSYEAPKATGKVNELMEADAEDESLRKYKEQLLGAAARGDLGDVSACRTNSPAVVFRLSSIYLTSS